MKQTSSTSKLKGKQNLENVQIDKFVVARRENWGMKTSEFDFTRKASFISFWFVSVKQVSIKQFKVFSRWTCRADYSRCKARIEKLFLNESWKCQISGDLWAGWLFRRKKSISSVSNACNSNFMLTILRECCIKRSCWATL